MKTVCPARMCGHSSGSGSFTFTIMSARCQTSGVGGDDLGAVGGVLLVGDAAAGPGAALDEHLVPGPGQFLDAGRHHRHAVLVRLDLLRNADDHRYLVEGQLEVGASIVGREGRENQGEVNRNRADVADGMGSRGEICRARLGPSISSQPRPYPI